MNEREYVKGVTVDGPTSRDLDDAIWVEKTQGGWEIMVSIADVSEYVAKGDKTDEYAFQRGFTTYRAWGNSPMLPRALAENSASLLPQKRRKTVTFFISLDAKLHVKDVSMQRTLLSSKKRFSYADVDKILDNTGHRRHEWWANCFELAQSLLNKRRELGALVIFDLSKGIFTTEDGEVERMPSGQYYRAYLIVQELMILTNHVVTAHLHEQGVMLLFRNHTTKKEGVKEHYLQALNELLIEPTAEQLKSLSDECRHILNRARYGPELEGHFGLNLSAYAHWTSPIRRYADLVNHRILVAWMNDEPPPYEREELRTIGEYLNQKVDKERDGKSDAMKSKLINQLQRMDTEQLVGLSQGHFRYFVEKLTDETFPLTKKRADALIKRIHAGAAGIVDIARILFVDMQRDTRWVPCKQAALQYVQDQPTLALQVMNHGHQVCGMPDTDSLVYSRSRTGGSHDPSHHVSVSLVYEGRVVTSATHTAPVVADAQHAAVADLVGVLTNLSAAQLPKKRAMGKRSGRKTPTHNPKSLLFEACQAHGIPLPELVTREFGGKMPKFECTVTLTHNNTVFTADSTPQRSKKEAEQHACTSLLAKLPKDFVTLEKLQKKLPNPQEDPVSALQQWCVQNKMESPQYMFKQAGSEHAPVFACTCSLTVDCESKEWTAAGQSKKKAKAEAAKLACAEVLP